MSIYQ